MFPYLLTFMYILSICVLSSAEVRRCYKLEVLNQIKKEEETLRYYVKSLTAEANYFDFVNVKSDSNNRDTRNFSEKAKNKPLASEKAAFRKRNRSLNLDISRPPNNSRINLYAVLLEPEASREESLSWFSILSRLLVQKYLIKETLKEYTPEDVNKLLLNIIKNKQKLLDLSLRNPSPDILFQLSLEDKKLSGLLNHLLIGGEDFPSLLCFLDCTPKKSVNFCKLNFLFLDSYILEAIFPKTSLLCALQEIQQKVFNEVLEREKDFKQSPSHQALKTRSEFKSELKEKVSKVLLDSGYNVLFEKNFFDFSLGKIGSYFLIKSAQEHSISRFKYLFSEDNLIERID